MPLNKDQLLAVLSAFPLTLSPTSACLSYGITTQMRCRDTPWYTALSSPFGWSSPGEASGSRACSLQGPGNTKGQGPLGPREVLQQLPQPLSLGLLLPLLDTSVKTSPGQTEAAAISFLLHPHPGFRVRISCSHCGRLA